MSEFEEFVRSQGFGGDFQRGCNGQYKSDLLHFMEKAFMHQQAKIDELKKLRSLDEMAINQLAQANQVWQIKCDELQARIDSALNTLCKLQYSSWERIYNDVGSILKGNKDGRV